MTTNPSFTQILGEFEYPNKINANCTFFCRLQGGELAVLRAVDVAAQEGGALQFVKLADVPARLSAADPGVAGGHLVAAAKRHLRR